MTAIGAAVIALQWGCLGLALVVGWLSPVAMVTAEFLITFWWRWLGLVAVKLQWLSLQLWDGDG